MQQRRFWSKVWSKVCNFNFLHYTHQKNTGENVDSKIVSKSKILEIFEKGFEILKFESKTIHISTMMYYTQYCTCCTTQEYRVFANFRFDTILLSAFSPVFLAQGSKFKSGTQVRTD